MRWCISSPESLCLSQRINIWESGHQNDWVHLKVQEARDSLGGDCDYQRPTSIWDFFRSYLCCASLSSLSGRPMMSATDLIVSWNNVPCSHRLFKEKDWSGPRVSMSQSKCGLPDRGPQTSAIKISRGDTAQVRASQNHEEVFLLNKHGLVSFYEIWF